MRSEAPTSAPWWRRQFNAAFRTTSVTSGRYQLSNGLVVATCALVPAYTIRWHLGPLPTTLLEVAILVTIAVFAAESASQKAIPNWRTALTAPAILFLIAGAISVVVAPDHRSAFCLTSPYSLK